MPNHALPQKRFIPWTSVLVFIFQFAGGLIVAAALLLLALNEIKGTPSMETVNSNTLTLAYLQKNDDSYATCADSVEYGISMVNDVILANTHYGMTQADSTKLNSIGADFMTQVKKQCTKPIADYKNKYATLKKTSEDIAKTKQSLFSKMLKNKPEVDQANLRAYDPDTIKLTSGDALSNFIFTKTDVEQYFTKRLSE